jgi:hypothetical protein
MNRPPWSISRRRGGRFLGLARKRVKQNGSMFVVTASSFPVNHPHALRRGSSLNFRAEKSASACLRETSDPAAGRQPRARRTGRMGARLALPAIHLPRVLKISQLAARLHIVAQGGSAGSNRLGKCRADCRNQTRGSCARHARRQPPGGKAGPEQRLADIYVAQARHDTLVQ